MTALYKCLCFFFFKQKTAYEMRISDWSSDVCSSDLSDQVAIRESVDARMRTEAGKPIDLTKQKDLQTEALDSFEEYIKWREKNPSDDKIGRASCRERVCQYG